MSEQSSTPSSDNAVKRANPRKVREGTEDAPEPLIKEADPEFERLLAQEEEIARTTREHHETPHFRPGDAD